MRILYLTFDDMRRHFAGTVHIRKIIEGLRARGHCVMLVAPGIDRVEGIDWVDRKGALPTGGGTAARMVKYLFLSILFGLRHAFRFRPSVIYCRGAHLNLTASILSWVTGRPLVTEINGLIEDEIHGGLKKWSARLFQTIQLRMSSRVITVCRQLRDCLRRRYRLSDSSLHVVPNGADLRTFFPRDRLPMRQRLGIPPSALVLLYAGSFYREHGLRYAIEAIGGFLRRNDVDVRLVFLGDGVDRPPAEDLVRKRGLSSRTLFIGEVPHGDVAEYMAAADVGLLLTVKSSSPVKLYEYMASSLAVVALVPSAEVADVIRGEEIGLVAMLADDGDENIRRVEAMLGRIAQHADLRKAMGARGRRLAEERYNWDRASGDVDEVLRSLPGNDGD